METQSKAKDFFINLGAIAALYTLVVSLVNLLFTVINSAYPQVTSGYSYLGSSTISWPVATLIIFFPIYIVLMWLLERDYKVNPDKQFSGIHKWLTYITLFLAGITLAVDLITVLYYFIDGQELTTGFILKVLVLLVIAGLIFYYYLSDAMGKLTSQMRMIFRVVAFIIILASIVWGFSVLGSPATQRLLKYDEQKVNDLMNLKNNIDSYYPSHSSLPDTLEEDGYIMGLDPQTNKPYEYVKTGKLTYNICAVFNKESPAVTQPNIYARPIGFPDWTHPAGHHCFEETINPNILTSPPLKY